MSSSRKEQIWTTGDCFLIPLTDGEAILGQVVAHEPMAMNSVSCALFRQKGPAQSLSTPDPQQLISVLLVTRELLDNRVWKVIGNSTVAIPESQRPYESTRTSGFVGAKIYGSRIVNRFANAFYGLEPWDNWADPHYLDALLLSPELKPKNLKYCK